MPATSVYVICCLVTTKEIDLRHRFYSNNRHLNVSLTAVCMCVCGGGGGGGGGVWHNPCFKLHFIQVFTVQKDTMSGMTVFLVDQVTQLRCDGLFVLPVNNC